MGVRFEYMIGLYFIAWKRRGAKVDGFEPGRRRLGRLLLRFHDFCAFSAYHGCKVEKHSHFLLLPLVNLGGPLFIGSSTK